MKKSFEVHFNNYENINNDLVKHIVLTNTISKKNKHYGIYNNKLFKIKDWKYDKDYNIVILLPLIQKDIEFIENSLEYNINNCYYIKDVFITLQKLLYNTVYK